MPTEPTETAPNITVTWEGHAVDQTVLVSILADGLGSELAKLLEQHVENCIKAGATVTAQTVDELSSRVVALVMSSSGRALGRSDTEATRLIRGVTVTRDATAATRIQGAPAPPAPEFSEVRAVIERDANGQAVAVRTIKAILK